MDETTPGDAAGELRTQWSNPSDILSLLLLMGGDIVQKAIAQLVGCRIHLPGHKATSGLSIVPVAFSFGWAAFCFTSLLAAIGDRKLMPAGESPVQVINCENGFSREARSWVLCRLLRDHETRYEIDPRDEDEGGRGESLRVDIFVLDIVSCPTRDTIWWLGWIVIAVQLAIAVALWVVYGDWGIMVVLLSGDVLIAVTCGMPQWIDEKWPGRLLKREKVIALTRGNGHGHVMIIISPPGSRDLESFATASSKPRKATLFVSSALAVLWTCLLISVSGLKEHTWFLVAIGGLGMVQNIFAAGVSRTPAAMGFHLTKFPRVSTIIGVRHKYKDDEDAHVDLDEDLKELSQLSAWVSEGSPQGFEAQATRRPLWLDTMTEADGTPNWLVALTSSQRHAGSVTYVPGGVHGALMELEKWVPTAGLALMQIYFPAGLKYNEKRIRDRVHKKFWIRAYSSQGIRKQGAEKTRVLERGYKV